MEPERWQEIERLCYSALHEEKSARAAFLERACGGDEALRRAVELLLAQHEKDDDFLEVPAMEVAAKALARDQQDDTSGVASPPPTGETAPDPTSVERISIGPYRLLQKLGEGGMGEVWLAEQSKPVRRLVALKLIKAGMDTREVVARFESERQALALMDHPIIAKVFDAGSTSEGRPYFVMEYVAGIPITTYCDKHRMTTRQRMELFIQVCEGVQHAHQKAIIHRDLKPSNILVSEVDGKPVPRIIDFGLAKATSQRLTDGSMYTRVGTLLGTLEYMSPEQADSAGEDIDTRTDVYSLGVVLYQLLVGALPLDLKKLAYEEILRRLRDKEIPKPSSRILTEGGDSAITAKNRGTDAPSLTRQLRGDPDAVVLKALEKDRKRRYGSPSELAADLGRYLRNEPVSAHTPSAAYRARKYARRHRAGLITASAFALLLIIAAVVGAWQSIQVRREAAVAQAVNDFLQNDLLAQASSESQLRANAKPDPNVTVRTLLDRAAQRIDGKFTNQPEVEFALRNTMGAAYSDLGVFADARQQLERALELGRQTLGASDPRVLTTLDRLGWVAFFQGRYAEAESLESQAVDARKRVLGPEDPVTLRTMDHLAMDYSNEGKYAKATELYNQVLEVQKRVLGLEHPDTLGSMANLAADYSYEGKNAQAEAIDAQVLEIRKRVLGPENPVTLDSMYNLGGDYMEEGKYAQTEKLYSQVLEIRRRVLGPEHPKTLKTMGNLAVDLSEEGKYVEAESLFSQTLSIQTRILGSENPETAETKYNAAGLEALRGNPDKAIALIINAVDHGLAPYIDVGIAKDTDLTSLHNDPRFGLLVAHAKQVARSNSALAHPSN